MPADATPLSVEDPPTINETLTTANNARVAAAFGEMLIACHQSLGGERPSLGSVAYWGAQLWTHTELGHTCLPLNVQEIKDLLHSPAISSNPDDLIRPIVFDKGALYLYKLWRSENQMAKMITGLVKVSTVQNHPSGKAATSTAHHTLNAQQHLAIALARTQRFTLLTGGPGTGKTATLAHILMDAAKEKLKIAVAAPTGKAASRLAQALSEQLASLQKEVQAPPIQPQTVHRLLLQTQEPEGTSFCVLPYDLLVVDEASMLDLETAEKLISSLPDSTRLVLSGDPNQLGSVAPGSVFADLCEHAQGASHLVTLEQNYRQQEASGIASLALAISSTSPQKPFKWLPLLNEAAWPTEVQISEPKLEAITAEAEYLWIQAVESACEGTAPEETLQQFERHRVLATIRSGPMGLAALNANISKRIRAKVRQHHSWQDLGENTEWFPGRLVLITQNDPDQGLFNGQTGVCLLLSPGNSDKLAIAFLSSSGIRWVPTTQLPQHETAFAITVHQAQGSEFEHVAWVAAPAYHPANTRELMYTAVTRARRHIHLWAHYETITTAANTQQTRSGNLLARLLDPVCNTP